MRPDDYVGAVCGNRRCDSPSRAHRLQRKASLLEGQENDRMAITAEAGKCRIKVVSDWPEPIAAIMNRRSDLLRFYGLLERLEQKVGGMRTLTACSGRIDWPRRGVYFFLEDGERRSDTGQGLRIVRVGTHAL